MRLKNRVIFLRSDENSDYCNILKQRFNNRCPHHTRKDFFAQAAFTSTPIPIRKGLTDASDKRQQFYNWD